MSNDPLVNAIEDLLTPALSLNPKAKEIQDAEDQLSSMFAGIVEAALHADAPITNFPVEKQIIDAVINVSFKILVDKMDELAFDAVSDLKEMKKAQALTDAANADNQNPTKENEGSLEDAASGLINIGAHKI